MGSLFVTIEEASNRLGRSKRSIHNYINKGYLRKTIQDGKVVLYKEEVEQLANDTGVDNPAFNRTNFNILMGRITKLEKDMGICRRALEIREHPLRPTKEEAIGLHAAASKALMINYWTDAELDTWASLFDRFDEVALDMFRDELASTKPYEVFYHLCLAQMRFVSSNVDFTTSLTLQVMHKRLDEGRKRMKTTLLMWVEMGRGHVSEEVLHKLETDKESMFTRLAKKVPKGVRQKGN